MMKRAVTSQVRQFLRAGSVAALACCPLMTVHGQEEAAEPAADLTAIDEVVIVVNRAGRPVDIDARQLDEILQKILREFELEQVDQEKEFWRQKFRSAFKRSSSRVAFGYDARWEAASVQYMHANVLPIDRVKPATILSVRF